MKRHYETSLLSSKEKMEHIEQALFHAGSWTANSDQVRSDIRELRLKVDKWIKDPSIVYDECMSEIEIDVGKSCVELQRFREMEKSSKKQIKNGNSLEKKIHSGLSSSRSGESSNTTVNYTQGYRCLLYTSPSPRDQRGSRMPSSA